MFTRGNDKQVYEPINGGAEVKLSKFWIPALLAAIMISVPLLLGVAYNFTLDKIGAESKSSVGQSFYIFIL